MKPNNKKRELNVNKDEELTAENNINDAERTDDGRFTEEDIELIERFKMSYNIHTNDRMDQFVRQWCPDLKGFCDINHLNLKEFLNHINNI